VKYSIFTTMLALSQALQVLREPLIKPAKIIPHKPESVSTGNSSFAALKSS
jgi:hypothetical protein